IGPVQERQRPLPSSTERSHTFCQPVCIKRRREQANKRTLLGSAPAFSNKFTACKLPLRAASINGVCKNLLEAAETYNLRCHRDHRYRPSPFLPEEGFERTLCYSWPPPWLKL